MNDGLVSVFVCEGKKTDLKRSKNWLCGQLSTFFHDFCASWESVTCQVTQKECWTCFGKSVGGCKDILYKEVYDEQKLLWPRGRIRNEESASFPNKQQLDCPVRVRTLNDWLFCDI